MATLKMDKYASYRSRRRAESREYWLIYCLLYPQLLIGAIANRIAALVVPRSSALAEPRRSVFAEARSSAASCIPFAFK